MNSETVNMEVLAANVCSIVDELMLGWGLVAWANCVRFIHCCAILFEYNANETESNVSRKSALAMFALDRNVTNHQEKKLKQICMPCNVLPFIFHVDVTSLICGMYFMFVISLIRFFTFFDYDTDVDDYNDCDDDGKCSM